MIKFLISLVKIVVTAIVALLFGACHFNHNSIKGSGKVVTENRNLNNFTKVELKKGLDCEIIQSKDFKVEVVADDNLVKDIETKLENETLIISCKYDNYINVKSKLVRVYIPIIKQLETTSGASMKTVGIIKSNNILLKSSSGSDLNANIESERINLESTSGSDLTVNGKAIELKTASSSGSDLDASNLLANSVTSQSTSGSNTEVHPLISLIAKASSGGSIDYVSSPKSLKKEESSGGSVSKE